MVSSLLKEYTVSIDIASFASLFWLDAHFFESFLVDQLHDKEVKVGQWKDIVGHDKKHMKTRTVKCFHPSKASYPGLPSHVDVSNFLHFLRVSPFC
jgi:hypothetical protein